MRAGDLPIPFGVMTILALLAVGCVDSTPTGTGVGGDQCNPTVTLKPASLTLAPGQTGTMAASVTACSLSQQITWIITDTSVAKATPTNDTTATIRALKVGTTGVVASLTARPNVVSPGTIFVQ